MPFPLIPILTPLAISIAGFMGFRNTNKNTATSLKLAESNIQAQQDLEENRQGFHEGMEIKRQDFQRQVEKFRATVSAAINQKNLDFQAWKFQEEVKLQFALAAVQRETALLSQESNRTLDNWPLTITPRQILKFYPDHLKIFISPPGLEYDRAIQFTDPNRRNSFSRIENFLGSRLLNLLDEHYPHNDSLRPTDLIDGAWDAGRYRGKASVIALASCLESEAFVILETKVTLNRYISLMVAYKPPGQNNCIYKEIIPRFDYSEILRASAKENNSQDPTAEDWEALYELLETAHCIVAAWIADVHHFLYYNAPPLLPHLLPSLLKDVPSFILINDSSTLNNLMRSIIDGYQAVLQQLHEIGRQQYLPDLFLDFALAALKIDNKQFAQELADASLTAWLESRNVFIDAEVNMLETMEPLLELSDVNYLRNLSHYFLSTQDELSSNKVGELLLIASDKKKNFQVTDFYSNNNSRFKIKKKKFTVVEQSHD